MLLSEAKPAGRAATVLTHAINLPILMTPVPQCRKPVAHHSSSSSRMDAAADAPLHIRFAIDRQDGPQFGILSSDLARKAIRCPRYGFARLSPPCTGGAFTEAELGRHDETKPATLLGLHR